MANVIVNPTAQQIDCLETLVALIKEEGFEVFEWRIVDNSTIEVKTSIVEADPENYSYTRADWSPFEVEMNAQFHRFNQGDRSGVKDYPISFVYYRVDNGSLIIFRVTTDQKAGCFIRGQGSFPWITGDDYGEWNKKGEPAW